MGLHIHY